VTKASVNVKLLTQRYKLRTSAKSGIKHSTTGPLSKQEEETLSHFLLQCPALSETRRQYMPRLLNLIRGCSIEVDVENILQTILDSSDIQLQET